MPVFCGALPTDPTGQLDAAWVDKEGMRDLHQRLHRTTAEAFLDGWLNVFAASGIGELECLALPSPVGRGEVLNYFDGRLTNGRTEVGT